MSHADKDDNLDQLFRHDLILGLLPGKENAISINTIRQRVANQGIDVSIKTIQRDMVELELKYPQVHNKPKGKAKLWWA